MYDMSHNRMNSKIVDARGCEGCVNLSKKVYIGKRLALVKNGFLVTLNRYDTFIAQLSCFIYLNDNLLIIK